MDKRFIVICMAYKIAGAGIILILHVVVGWRGVRGGRSDVTETWHGHGSARVEAAAVSLTCARSTIFVRSVQCSSLHVADQ